MTSTPGRTSPSGDTSERPFLIAIDVARGRISVHGDLDRAHVQRLFEALRVLRQSPSPSWTVDVSSLDFCDAGGLRALLAGREAARIAGRSFIVARSSPWLRHLMRLVGLAPPERPAPPSPAPSGTEGVLLRLVDS